MRCLNATVAGLAILLSSQAAIAAEIPTADEMSGRVDSMFARYNRPESAGCSIGIIQQGRLIYSKGFGSANLDHEVPNTPHTVFDTGSVSKSFTCACLAILLDQGKLSPDDDIRKYLPELHAFDPPIRIRHVVRCRDGIWAQWHIQQLAGWTAQPIEAPYREHDLLTLLAGQKTLPFEPGTEFQYGTGGYFLLGILVKRVTGLTLAEFAKKNLFEPLEMTSTFYMEEPHRIVKHRAIGYYQSQELPPSEDRWAQWMQNSSTPGGRGLFSSVEDLYRWAQNFDANRLPAGKFMDEFIQHGTLLDNRNVLDNNPTGEYRGLKRIQFTGGMPGFGAAITRFPEQQFTVICLSNNESFSPSSITSQIADIYLADALEPRPPADAEDESRLADKVTEVDERDLQDKTGAYRLRGDRRIWKIVVDQGGLRVIDSLNRSLPLTPMGNNRFRPEGGFFDASSRLVFARSSPDQTFSLTNRWRGGSMAADRVDLVEPTKTQLNEYAGEYHSDELATTYRIKAGDARLLLRVNNFRWEPLDPTVQDEFIPGVRRLYDNRIFRFVRNDAGKVIGLSASLWRIRGVHFTRREP